jgi:hypothetical protein
MHVEVVHWDIQYYSNFKFQVFIFQISLCKGKGKVVPVLNCHVMSQRLGGLEVQLYN